MQPRVLGVAVLLSGAYAVLGLLFGSVRLWDDSGLLLIGNSTCKIAALAALLFGVIALRRSVRVCNANTLYYCSIAVLILVLFSDFITRPFGFYNNGSIARADILIGGVLLSLVYFALRVESRNSNLLSILPLVALQLFITFSYYKFAGGRLLWSDDHPSFLYRLELLRDNFPFIPFYNPAWNLGYQAREFFATGVLNVFLLTAPVLYFIKEIRLPEDAVFYSYLIPYLFVWIVPWSIYLAARVLRYPMQVAGLAAILSLAPSASIFEWALKYGTLAFVLSAGLFPLTLALSFRLALDTRPPRYSHVLALIIAASLCLMWTLTSVALVPIFIVALLKPKQLIEPVRCGKILLFVILFALCNGPWIVTFVRESQVVDFVAQSNLPGVKHSSHEISQTAAEPSTAFRQSLERHLKLIAKKGVNRFREGVSKINPLVLFLGLAGIALMSDRRLRMVFATTVIVLAVTTLIGDPLKPQLELRRMLLHVAFLLSIPTADAVQNFLQLSTSARPMLYLQRIVSIILLGAVGITPLSAQAAYLSRSSEQFLFASSVVSHLSHAIREHGGTGVTFFAGFILHDLSATNSTAQNGGHIAPLATFTKKYLYASDYIHRKWSSVDPIPKVYRDRGSEGIEEFLDLVNATAVVTFTRPWAQYCRTQARYESVFHEGNFRLFKRSGGPESFFYRGKGEIVPGDRELTVRPESEEVVIRFRYLPGLTVSHPEDVEIFPVLMFEEEQGGSIKTPVSFIGINSSKRFLQSRQVVHIGYFAKGAR